MRDWREWHRGYDDPESALSQRLAAVQRRIRAFLDAAPAGPVSVTSACSGLGLDLVGALSDHPRRADVSGVLVELDSELAQRSRRLLHEAGLRQLEVREADAGHRHSYAGAPPADLLLLCGVFGNISDADVERTVRQASSLCAPGATAIWTRHRRAPDLTPRVRQWWQQAGWTEVAFESPGPEAPSVGVAQLAVPPRPGSEDVLFVFT